MSETNDETLRSYEARIQDYIEGTSPDVAGGAVKWLDKVLAELKLGARVLEIGSAYGRDATYMQAKGFRVECTDAAQGFVRELKARGFDARSFNLLTDPLEPIYDLIFANAVFLHFDRGQFVDILRKMRGALKPGGVLAFSLKGGEGEEWSSKKIGAPRYFCYWRAEQLPPLLDSAGFAYCRVEQAEMGRAHPDWLFVTAFA